MDDWNGAHLYIDGSWQRGAGSDRDILNPANAQSIVCVHEASLEQVQQAVSAAQRSFDSGIWTQRYPQERARVLRRVADSLEEQRDSFARLETQNTGKTLSESLADMDNIAEVFRYYAALVLTQGGDINPVAADALSQSVYEPIGVVAMITPWNYPLLQLAWKVAPALAAGCSFVAKPSELTPLSSLKLMTLLEQAGLPAGVANVVLGSGAEVGKALVEHPQVAMVSFTGGIVTGRAIAASAAAQVKRVALELGGKNPNIICADADVDTAVDYALQAVFYHAGQVCSAGARLLLHASIHDRFLEALLARAAAIRLGFGDDPDTEMGPLISAAHRDNVEGYIALAQREGARLRLGGQRPEQPALQQGFFLQPTIFSDVDASMRIAREEVFGPVLTVERFDDEAEAIATANATETGLAAAVWTQDVARGQHLARRLHFGTVWINDFHPYYPAAPWGGFKQSGNGRELGRIGLQEYLEPKHIYLNLAPKASGWFGRQALRSASEPQK